MYPNVRPEKIAHLVMSATDAEKLTSHNQVHDFNDVHEFIEKQSPDTEMLFTWHYLDPQLRRRLALTCARQAVRLSESHLEVPRFTVVSHELYEAPHPETMGALVLNASGMFESHSTLDLYIQVGMQNPSELYKHYHALRRRTSEQLAANETIALRGLDAPIREFGGSPPAA